MKLVNKYIILFIITIVTICASNIHWGKNNWKDIIEADGKGYYAYLPAAFIYHDFNFSFFDSIERKYPNPHIYYDYRVGEENKKTDKYFVGTAVAMAPFFFIANVSAMLSGFDADGYSKSYPIMINIAAIFYLFIGLYYLKKLLKNYKASDNLISFILVAITFATNIFYYAVREPSMSHIYSFAFITMFVYYLHSFFILPRRRTILIICVLLGMIVLIRPVNGLIILIVPFVSGNRNSLLNGFAFLKKHLFESFIGLCLFFSIVFLQLLIYKIQTGNFWVDTYGAEKFNWADPHPISFLISYKKGLFVYTPLTFISLLGMCQLFKQNKFQFYSLGIFLIVLLYVLSSWWNWWYGGSFSSRVCIEYYAILGLLICFAYQKMKLKGSRTIYSCLIICLVIICQIQTYQYRYYFIHWEKMDKVHYWNVFLRVDEIGKVNPNADLLKEN
jgi:hypothetical protein